MANGRLTCCQCQLSLANLCELEKHICVVHLEWNRFECMYCSNEFFLAVKKEMNSHIQETHPGKQMKFYEAVDMDKLAKLKDWLARSNPSKGEAKDPLPNESAETEEERNAESSAGYNVDSPVPMDGASETETPHMESQSTEPSVPNDEPESPESTPQIPKRRGRGRPPKKQNSGTNARGSKTEQTTTKRRIQTRSTTRAKRPSQEPKITKKPKQQKRKAVENENPVPDPHEEIEEPMVEEPVVQESAEAPEPEPTADEAMDLADSPEVERPFCKQCKTSGFKIRAHIIQVHLGKKCVFCPHCSFGDFYRKKLIKTHILRRHPGEELRVRDERHLHNEEISKLKKELFGIEDPPIPLITIDLD